MASSPIALVALVAAIACMRQRDRAYTHAVVAISIMFGYLVLIAGWSGSQLVEDPGPRYLVPALPFLAVPLALAGERFRRIAVAATAWGALVMAGALYTPHLTNIGAAPSVVYFDNVQVGKFNATVWSMALGRAGVVLYLAGVGLAVFALVRAVRRDTNGCSPLG
jgi:hypothetical protein